MALLAAAGTAVVALALRLPIVGYGLPFLWHPDEPTNVGVGARMVDLNSWNPHFFLYPSMLYDVVAIVGHLQRAFGGWHVGAGQSSQVMGTGYTTDPHLYLALRLITVALSVGTCIVVCGIVYLVTKRWWAAALAGLLLAVSPLMVLNGVYITPDTYSAFFTACGLLTSYWVLNRGRRLDYVLAGLVVGLAAGVKYIPAMVALSVVAAHFLRSSAHDTRESSSDQPLSSKQRTPRWLREAPLLLLAGIVAIGAFLLTTPGAIASPHQFLTGIGQQSHVYATSDDPGITGSSFVFYLHVLAHQGLLIGIIAAVGLVSLIGRWWRYALCVFGFVVCYTAVISAQTLHFDRQLLPVMVGVAVLTGIGAASAADRIRRFGISWAWVPRARVTFLATAIIVVGLVTSARSSTRDYALAFQRPRSEAQSWIYKNIPKKSTIVAEIYGPWIDPEKYHLLHVAFAIAANYTSLESKAAAIVVTQYGTGRYLAYPGVYKSEVAAYTSLANRFCEKADFRNGPWIRIFVPCSAN
jgi:hypothetical protein